jgi:tetratricopeptide (TPR) repeat protein
LGDIDSHSTEGAVIQNYIGMAQRALGKNNEAIECFDKAIDSMETFNKVITSRTVGSIYHNRGYTYGSTGEYERAIKDFEKAIYNFQNSDDLDLVYTLRNKGYAHAMSGEKDETIMCLDEGIGKEKQFGYAQNGKGFIHMQFLEFDKALECFEQATDINPNLALNFVKLKEITGKSKKISTVIRKSA